MVTKPDAEWLAKLLEIVEHTYENYPELFSSEDEETVAIAGSIIEGMQ